MPKTYYQEYCKDRCITTLDFVEGVTLLNFVANDQFDWTNFDWNGLINKIWTAVEKFHKDTGRAHGDLNYSNIMWNNKNKTATLIDPIRTLKNNLTVAQDLLRLHLYFIKDFKKNKNNKLYQDRIRLFNNAFFEKISKKDPNTLKDYYDAKLKAKTTKNMQANTDSEKYHMLSVKLALGATIEPCMTDPLKCLKKPKKK